MEWVAKIQPVLTIGVKMPEEGLNLNGNKNYTDLKSNLTVKRRQEMMSLRDQSKLINYRFTPYFPTVFYWCPKVQKQAKYLMPINHGQYLHPVHMTAWRMCPCYRHSSIARPAQTPFVACYHSCWALNKYSPQCQQVCYEISPSTFLSNEGCIGVFL